MGDRTWVSIELKGVDFSEFNKVMIKLDAIDATHGGVWWDNEHSEEFGVVTVHIDEANYGWFTELHTLSKAGLTFLASNGAGGTYGPREIACFKGDIHEVHANEENYPVVICSREGPDKEEVEKVLKYWEVYHQVKKYLSEPVEIVEKEYQCQNCGVVVNTIQVKSSKDVYIYCENCRNISEMECLEGKPEEWVELFPVRKKLLKNGGGRK